jgi:hypothetical protein
MAYNYRAGCAYLTPILICWVRKTSEFFIMAVLIKIFDKTKQNRGYKDSITLQNVKFLIKSINKDKVPKAYKAMIVQIAQGNEYWSVKLNVAVVKFYRACLDK